MGLEWWRNGVVTTTPKGYELGLQGYRGGDVPPMNSNSIDARKGTTG